MKTAVTHLHPEEDSRQATSDNDHHPILANTAWLGYYNRLLVELLLGGTHGYDSVDATRQDNPRFWCDRLSTAVGRLKHRKFSITGYMRKLILPDGKNTRRKCYQLADRNAALQAIHYLNGNQTNNKPPVFSAEQTEIVLKRFTKRP